MNAASFTRTRFALLALFVLVFAVPARASVDDAHSFAMEAATPFVEQGFIVREDYWNGEVKSGQQLMIRHQLFRGNEYAFWLGTANENCKLDLQVLDANNKPIQITTKIGVGPTYTSIRVNPPATGSYTLIFSVTSKTDASVFWALAYGYH
jgi:hypothetical protein